MPGNDDIQQRIERAVIDCVDQRTMPRDLLEEKLDRIITAVDGTNKHLTKLNGSVASNQTVATKYLEWRSGHAESHEELERRIKAVEGENRVINILQALWAPLAAYLASIFFKGSP